VKHGYVISDLHLFTRRSSAGEYMQALHDAAAAADFFVLNGDIVDFRWSVHDGTEATIRATLDWLEELISPYPDCRFFYIMGNHDGCQPLAEALQRFAETTDNFDWNDSHLRIANTLFLHGDLPLERPGRDICKRPLDVPEDSRHPSHHLIYDALVALRMHVLATRLSNARKSARLILQNLRSFEPELAEGLTDVYFGHVHRTLQDYVYDGVRFHNTGASIRGVDCRVLRVRT
jgi:UDP-2,3-diacylglucosamine hydrolase